MKRFLYLFVIILHFSCQKSNDNTELQQNERTFKLVNKEAKFLWREELYDSTLKDTFNTIVINEELCKSLTEPEKAALGYVVTFIGSDCNWDGKAANDFSNLKCKTLTALGLGYQCSDTHLNFLRKWFKNDPKILKELEKCPTIPYTASKQSTFDYINIKVSNNKLSVKFAANGVNMQMGQSWSWTETDHFVITENSVKLIKKEESEVKRVSFDM